MNSISLKGSSKTVIEFFEFAINSILYQRGLYSQDIFKSVRKYNLVLFVCQDHALEAYLNKFLAQIHEWINNQKISRLVMVIMNKQTKAVTERWQFDINIDNTIK